MPKITTILATLSIVAGSLLFPSTVQAEGEELPGFGQGKTKVFQNQFGEGVKAILKDPRWLAFDFDAPEKEGFKAIEVSMWVARPNSTLTVEEMTTLSQEVGLQEWTSSSWYSDRTRLRADSYNDLTVRDLKKSVSASSPAYLAYAPYHTVFYLAEYRDVNNIYSAGYFVRGAIDFRSCVRAKKYASYEVDTCETIMAEDQTFALVPTGTVLKKESYGTWKDIVAEMAEEWMEGSIAKIELAEQKKNSGNLTEEEKAEIEEVLKTMKSDAERFGVDFTTYFNSYELRVTALLEDNEESNSSNTGNTSSSGHSHGFGSIITETEVEEVSKEVTQEKTDVSGVEGKTEVVTAVNANKEVNTEDQEDKGDATDEDKDEAVEESISTEDVEVPKLGGGTKRNWGWLLLVPVIGALVGIIFWAKRQKTGEN